MIETRKRYENTELFLSGDGTQLRPFEARLGAYIPDVIREVVRFIPRDAVWVTIYDDCIIHVDRKSMIASFHFHDVVRQDDEYNLQYNSFRGHGYAVKKYLLVE